MGKTAPMLGWDSDRGWSPTCHPPPMKLLYVCVCMKQPHLIYLLCWSARVLLSEGRRKMSCGVTGAWGRGSKGKWSVLSSLPTLEDGCNQTITVYCGCKGAPRQIQPRTEFCPATADSCSVRNSFQEGEGLKDFVTSKVFLFFPLRPGKLIFSSQQSRQEKMCTCIHIWVLTFAHEYQHLWEGQHLRNTNNIQNRPVWIMAERWSYREMNMPNWNARKNIRKCLWVNYSFPYIAQLHSIFCHAFTIYKAL